MSHALCLVFTESGTPEEVAEAMAPYDENLDTDRSQWDWWVIGGRAEDCLLRRDGKWVNVCRRSELDYEGMCADQAARLRGEDITPHLWAPHSIVVNGEWITWDDRRAIPYPEDFGDNAAWDAFRARCDEAMADWCRTWLRHIQTERGTDLFVTAVDFHR